MKKMICAVIFFCITAVPLFAEKPVNPFDLPPDANSAAYEPGSFGYMANPVFTDSRLTPDIAYRYINSEGNTVHHAMITLFGFTFGYSHYNALYSITDSMYHKSDVSLYSINRGIILGDSLGIGAGYSAGFSDIDGYDGYRGWNIGLLYRPYKFISFGAVIRGINGELDGIELKPQRIYSIAIRPFCEWLTLSADYATSTALSSSPAWSFSGRATLWHDASIFIKGDTSYNFQAGLSLPLDMRFSNPVNITADFYKSYNDEDPKFFSTGAAIRFKRGSAAVLTAAHNLIHVKIEKTYAENGKSGFFIKRKPEFLVLVNGIKRSAEDPTINGAVIEIGDLDMGFAQLQELRKTLKLFQGKGKKVYAIMNSSGNREYYLASCADIISFTPNTEFDITGLSANVYFIKGLLDKAGIKFESIKRGDYKSFNEPFTRTEMSPEAKSNLTAVLTDLNEQFIAGLTERKTVTRDSIRELFKTGLYTAEEAKAKGFIDEVMYGDDMIESLEKENSLVEFEDYASEEIISERWGSKPEIAVVYVTGNIISGEGDQGGFNSSTGDSGYRKILEEAFQDDNIKGVVIRIDSGGGSAVASDYMWKSLVYLKKKYPKPVVFSFGNMAASGGYYISCTGDRVFAENGTITGSIGVISGKITAKELYAKLGINKDTVSLSEFADIYNESRPLTENEYKLLDRKTGLIYDRFTQKVIEARKIPAADIEKIAGGRVHTGLAARGNGLVDEEGGILTAISFCRSMSGIDDEFRIVQFPDNSGIFSGIGDITGTATSTEVLDIFLKNLQTLNMLDGQVLYLQPYVIEIE